MNLVNIKQAQRHKISHPIFRGPEVEMKVEVEMQELAGASEQLVVNNVHFSKGVRCKWHAHDQEQIIMVSGGKGVVALEDEEKIVTEGDVIVIPKGAKHWHGSDDSEFSQIYITVKGEKVTVLED
ncbi:MAG: cupin domain-containing protein [Deltaproteobacteria bacterium]|jgi:quercetin dioxygenase-like cupin family protein|nr:cupin domain-containing protein [Deltaproteobacteria bacterium]MBT6502727.1 cupin domain-containing protein [Deltaproteobacteria bacterium]MBT6613016.1 cupin domain-containing protein [Deltaproteobacteria bacterium]MBT7711958.1 cupin domain-containing protein [Deltaproteobacteria bacterium]MBT7890609.1 cupin domain-containing protein [Deltaproteobacteria bacterium]